MRRVALVLVALSMAAAAAAACSDDAAAPTTAEDAGDAAGEADVTPDGGGSDAGGSDAVVADAGGPWLDIAFRRIDGDGGPSPFEVVVTVRDPSGAPLAAKTVDVRAPGHAVTPAAPDGGAYVASVTPSCPSCEVRVLVDAQVGSTVLTDTKVALALPFVGSAWEQPEAVPGAVNTPGYEDGVVVSPDGEWLFVDSYSPVDAICCLTGCGQAVSPSSLACQTALGPYGPPLRPGMLGADRIVSSTHILNRCDKLCFTGADGGEVESFPLPPVASYGFHRQADGSFAQPFVIGFDADGCNAPFGLSLTGPPSGTAAEAVFAATDPMSSATGNDLFYARLTLGVPNVLGKFSCPGGVLQASDITVSRLGIHPLDGSQGNPQWSAPWLFFDDDLNASPPTMFVAKATGALPDASFTATAPLPVGSPADDRRQPFLAGSELYFAQNLTIARSHLAGDPTVAASWSAPVRELAAENGAARTGALIALGQPTVAARPGGASELYFVYGVKTATGVDMQAGRVRRR